MQERNTGYFGKLEQDKGRPYIAIIGVGVIGLASAVLAQQKGYHVTIYSSLSPDKTTSMKAGASFKPHKVDDNGSLNEMVLNTWKYYNELDKMPGSGVRRHRHFEASRNPIDENQKFYLPIMEDMRRHDHSGKVPGNYPYALEYTTFLIDPNIFIPYLVKMFRQNGGKLIEGKIFQNVAEFESLEEEVIINCTGLGARELVNDSNVIPVKGQIVVTDAIPGVEYSISADGKYIYPREGNTALGGTTEEGLETETVDEEIVESIIRGNKPVLEELGIEVSPNNVKKAYAGLRPYRRGGVRVEREIIGTKVVIHNYGHGGSGFTLAWGSAERALGLIDPALF